MREEKNMGKVHILPPFYPKTLPPTHHVIANCLYPHTIDSENIPFKGHENDLETFEKIKKWLLSH